MNGIVTITLKRHWIEEINTFPFPQYFAVCVSTFICEYIFGTYECRGT